MEENPPRRPSEWLARTVILITAVYVVGWMCWENRPQTLEERAERLWVGMPQRAAYRLISEGGELPWYYQPEPRLGSLPMFWDPDGVTLVVETRNGLVTSWEIIWFNPHSFVSWRRLKRYHGRHAPLLDMLSPNP